MMERARQALLEQKVGERDFRGSTFAICRKDYLQAKQIIKEFHAQMHQLMAKGDADEVYHIHTQFFRVTRGEAVMTTHPLENATPATNRPVTEARV